MIRRMSLPFSIRPARAADADAIAHVHHQSWGETYPGLMPPELLARVTLDYRLCQWRRLLADPAPGIARFVAETEATRGGAAENNIVGVCQCGPPQQDQRILACRLRRPLGAGEERARHPLLREARRDARRNDQARRAAWRDHRGCGDAVGEAFAPSHSIVMIGND
jgi:hypothetical protein